jgi:transaldolase / glucose-6-phosphate isomerase
MTNPLQNLATIPQSPWFDYIDRNLLDSGKLAALIEQDGLKGVTSNPAIFQKAIASGAYADFVSRYIRMSAFDVYEQIAIAEIQRACDELSPVYEASGRTDGFVSLEVSPLLADDEIGTIDEAQRLWSWVDRPNLMVKVPGTAAGIRAIQELIASGVNINVTLLFSVETYERVARAYIAGLQEHVRRGGDPSKVASVASFFVSRIDTAVDKLLAAKIEADPGLRPWLKPLAGKVAIANAKIAYERYIDVFGGSDWQSLAGQGAHTQRLLWASTSTKDPAYPDTLYVDALIGPDTVNTIPPATWDAFRDHGTVAETLTTGCGDAYTVMETLVRYGISLEDVTAQLLVDGVQLFVDAFKELLRAVEGAQAAAA